MDDMKACPYCAEDIKASAIRCPRCQSRLVDLDPEQWHRDHAGRRVAGVASALSRAIAVPVGIVRAGFVVLSFVHLVGLVAYAALWLLIPFTTSGSSVATRLLEWLHETIDGLLGRSPADPDGDRRSSLPGEARS